MELVLTHNNMDFDSLAAQFGVTKLHPAARMILGFPLTGNVRDFLALHRSSLPIAQIKYLNLDTVARLYIVDCQHYERLDGTAKSLIDRGVPFTIFDHHERDPQGLTQRAEPESLIEPVGAATTLVVSQIKAKDIKLTPFEATLLSIGIYEDTGCLTFRGTTALDAECLAYLIKSGADLNVVNEFIHPKLNEQQNLLMQDLFQNVSAVHAQGAKIVVATTTRDIYIDGLATLTRKLLEFESADAAFSVVQMSDRVHVVARSDCPSIDVRSVVREFGGGGHPGAASAVVRHGHVSEIANKVMEIASRNIAPQKIARELMTTPVRTVLPAVSMDEAARIMIRHGLDGLLVAENEQILGVISRRDVDQATHHKLGHAPVLGFMSKPVITVSPETSLNEIQHLMIHEDIGRLPVIDESGRLLGIVSRQNVLETLYEPGAERDGETAERARSQWRWRKRTANFRERLCQVEPSILDLSRKVGEAAVSLNMVAYAVGGFVRDLILDRANFDLDYVIEGSAVELADKVQELHPDELEVVAKHERFQTATLNYRPSGANAGTASRAGGVIQNDAAHDRSVDFSTARTEFYEYPAALPTVEPSRLDQDLMRRDFTINAMAICVNPDRFGQLIDEFGGLDDIREKLVRVLHPFSFIEDPTRIMRAVRFATRLNFSLEPATMEQARHAIATGLFDDLGGTRIRDEFQLILESPNRLNALALLSSLGAKLRYLDSELEFTNVQARAISRAGRLLKGHSLKNTWIVYLGLLIANLSFTRVEAVLERLHLTNEQKEIILEALAVRSELPNIFEELGRNGHGLTNSQVFRLLRGKSDETLAIVACLAAPGSPVRRLVKLYLEELEQIKIETTGNDLVAMGFKQGPIIGQVLNGVLAARLDGKIVTRDDELKFIQENFSAQLRE